MRRGPHGGPARAPPSEFLPEAAPRTQEDLGPYAAHLGARWPPGRRLQPAASRRRAPPQPAASSAAGEPRLATPLARSPSAPPRASLLAPRVALPALPALNQCPLAAPPVPRPSHWLPARPALGGAQVWAELGGAEGRAEPRPRTPEDRELRGSASPAGWRRVGQVPGSAPGRTSSEAPQSDKSLA